MTKKQFNIKGMSCVNCAIALEKGLSNEESINSAKVNFSANFVILDFDEAKINSSKIIESIQNLGYEATDTTIQKIELNIKGMSCINCVKAVEKSLTNINGILSSSINLSTEKALIEYTEDSINISQILQIIQNAGYSAELISEVNIQSKDESQQLKMRLTVSPSENLILIP